MINNLCIRNRSSLKYKSFFENLNLDMGEYSYAITLPVGNRSFSESSKWKDMRYLVVSIKIRKFPNSNSSMVGLCLLTGTYQVQFSLFPEVFFFHRRSEFTNSPSAGCENGSELDDHFEYRARFSFDLYTVLG